MIYSSQLPYWFENTNYKQHKTPSIVYKIPTRNVPFWLDGKSLRYKHDKAQINYSHNVPTSNMFFTHKPKVFYSHNYKIQPYDFLLNARRRITYNPEVFDSEYMKPKTDAFMRENVTSESLPVEMVSFIKPSQINIKPQYMKKPYYPQIVTSVVPKVIEYRLPEEDLEIQNRINESNYLTQKWPTTLNQQNELPKTNLSKKVKRSVFYTPINSLFSFDISKPPNEKLKVCHPTICQNTTGLLHRNQCVAIAFMSLVYGRILDMTKLNKNCESFLNNIIRDGDFFYGQIIQHKNKKSGEFLSADDVDALHYTYVRYMDFEVLNRCASVEYLKIGNVKINRNKKNKTIPVNFSLIGLYSGDNNDFNRIGTLEGDVFGVYISCGKAIGIFKCNNIWFLFDSHEKSTFIATTWFGNIINYVEKHYRKKELFDYSLFDIRF